MQIQAKDLNGGTVNGTLSSLPDTCPRCGRSIQAKFYIASAAGDRIQCAFRCTSLQCQELFLANYTLKDVRTGERSYTFNGTAPVKHRAAVFNEGVAQVSPAFVEIFNQAEAAASLGFDQLVGIGYRKALEFLVKDYAISQAPEDADAIRGKLLAAAIADHIADPNVKECAKRAAWLGNDETHYVRKWSTYDVRDLKVLLHLTVNWIDNSLTTKKYLAEMDSGKK